MTYNINTSLYYYNSSMPQSARIFPSITESTQVIINLALGLVEFGYVFYVCIDRPTEEMPFTVLCAGKGSTL